MDHIRKALDDMMGSDRNIPLAERLTNKVNFDSPDV